MDLQLRDRVYVVTGASRGLGLATARCLVDEGARVVISSRDPERLAVAAGQLGQAARVLVVDNAEPGAVDRLSALALDTWGRLDGALISVGGPPLGSVGGAAAVTDEQWTDAFSSVFLGTVRLCRELSARLGEGGSLALVLSTSVRSPLADMAISNGLRPGLAMVAKTLADEVGPRGVRVNGLLPGRIRTDRIVELEAGQADPEASRAAAVRGIPLRRDGEPDEFGRVAAFVLSPAASYVTGAMIPVDGGVTRAL